MDGFTTSLGTGPRRFQYYESSHFMTDNLRTRGMETRGAHGQRHNSSYRTGFYSLATYIATRPLGIQANNTTLYESVLLSSRISYHRLDEPPEKLRVMKKACVCDFFTLENEKSPQGSCLDTYEIAVEKS